MGFDKQPNVYVCQTCGGKLLSEKRDEGTTPFMIGCRMGTDCDGDMHSTFGNIRLMMRVTLIDGPDPAILFIKPTEHELQKLKTDGKWSDSETKSMREYSAGGALIDVDNRQAHGPGSR